MDNRNSPPPLASTAAAPRVAPVAGHPVPPCPYTVKALTDLAQVARQVI